MNAGIGPNEDCVKVWETKLKLNPKIQGMSMKWNGQSSFELDREFERGFDFREFAKDNTYLPKDQGRLVSFLILTSILLNFNQQKFIILLIDLIKNFIRNQN